MDFKLDVKTAKKLYPESKKWFQEELERVFGKDCFKEKSFTDFKTFNDLCVACGTTEKDFNRKWKDLPIDPSTLAFEKIKILTKAYNQNWEADIYDTAQKKWYPWFEVLSSGFGFSTTYFSYAYTRTGVGSRLCFETEEKAIHAGKKFTKIFEEFITAKV